MATSILILALVAGAYPAHGECPQPQVMHQSGFLPRLREHAYYSYWAYHGAYYQQWHQYDYRLQFDYPWADPNRPPAWPGYYSEPAPQRIHSLAPQPLELLAPADPRFSARPRPPAPVTRIGKTR